MKIANIKRALKRPWTDAQPVADPTLEKAHHELIDRAVEGAAPGGTSDPAQGSTHRLRQGPPPERRVTVDVTEEQALAVLAQGFDRAESHPACIRFHRTNGTLTLWDSEPDSGRSWELEVEKSSCTATDQP